MSIQSFRSHDTARLYCGEYVPKLVRIRYVAQRKLQMLDDADTLDFLRTSRGNRLEMLKGDRAGQFSIRVNDQYRICFRWTDAGPEEVEIVDYH